MSNQRWPTIESGVFFPGARLGLAFGLVFGIVGWAVFLYLLSKIYGDWVRVGSLTQLWQQQPPWPVVALLPGASAGFGTLLTFGALSAIRNNTRFRHAAPGVLPEIPSEPCNSPGLTTHASLTHAIFPKETGWCLAPRRDLYRRRPLFAALWMLFVYSIALALIATGDIQSGVKAGLAFIAFVCAAVPVAALVLITKREIDKLLTLSVDVTATSCQIDSQPPRTIALADVVAVQLCACRRRIGGKYRSAIIDALELNLVWRHAGHYDRVSLLSNSGQMAKVSRLAVELAEKLDVPLLNHATEQHWRAERKAASARAPQAGSELV